MDETQFELDALAIFFTSGTTLSFGLWDVVAFKSLGYRTGVLDMTRVRWAHAARLTCAQRRLSKVLVLTEVGFATNLGQPDGHVWLTKKHALPLFASCVPTNPSPADYTLGRSTS